MFEDGRNEIDPTAWIHPNTEIGKGNKIGPYAVIGWEGEIRGGKDYKGKVVIGDNNIINAHTTIDRPLEGKTIVGNDNYIMTKAHLGHDVVIGNGVTICSGALIGGHVIIEDYATIGLGASIHQRIVIGQGSMIGMNSVINKNVYPFRKMVGINRHIGTNKRGLDKVDKDYDFMEEKIIEFKSKYE